MINLNLVKYSDLTDEELREKAQNTMDKYQKAAKERLRNGDSCAAEALYRVGLKIVADLQTEMNLRQWKRLMYYEQIIFEE